MRSALVLLALAALAGLAIALPAGAKPASSGLDILLTNDDGITAPGLVAVRDALCKAGDHVTVVAPDANASGSGGRITPGGSLKVAKSTYDCNGTQEQSWAIGGSPADTVLVAMSQLYADHKPDLVVSGSNAGQNLSGAINHSGTVGAALTGAELGVPAIAISTGISFVNGQPDPASATAAYPPTAALLAKTVTRLAATRKGGALLPSGVTLNMNYPSGDGVKDLELTRISPSAPIGVSYTPAADGSLTVGFAGVGSNPGPKGSDDREFAAGHPTLTPIVGGRQDAPKQVRKALAKRLGL